MVHPPIWTGGDGAAGDRQERAQSASCLGKAQDRHGRIARRCFASRATGADAVQLLAVLLMAFGLGLNT